MSVSAILHISLVPACDPPYSRKEIRRMKRSLFAAAVCGVAAAPAMAGSVVMDNTAGLAGTPGASGSNLGYYRRAI